LSFKILSATFGIPANDDDIGDIEFTVTTLNCSHNNESAEHTTPPHERKRFSSLRKTGALGKAVRQRLAKSMYQGNAQPSEDEKLNICAEEKVAEEKPAKPESATSVAPTTATKEPKSGKLYKKKSKLCSLL
jgi:cGMP-specific 3',5'-cyclic phosphodiesterase, invertebrate